MRTNDYEQVAFEEASNQLDIAWDICCEYEDVKISKHALKRIKERVGIKKRSNILKFAQDIYELGYREDEPKCIYGSILKRAKIGWGEAYCQYAVRGNYVAVFNGRVLITVLPINGQKLKSLEKMRMKYNKCA